MCRVPGIGTSSSRDLSGPSQPSTTATDTKSLFYRVWPVSPWIVALTLFPYVVFSSALLNAGYTKWFHWNSFFFLLTQNEFQCKLLAMQGLTVTMGWYASLFFDWFMCSGNQFGRILYWNMPGFLVDHMVHEGELLYLTTTMSLVCMLTSHILDFLGHPILTYYYWRRTWQQSNGKESSSNTSIDHARGQVLTWPVIATAYALSRTWSIVHTWYNHGTPSLFYFGYDVYVILDKEAWLEGMWLPAYIMEGLVFLGIVVYKLLPPPTVVKDTDYVSSLSHKKKTDKDDKTSAETLDKTPSLLRASTISDS